MWSIGRQTVMQESRSTLIKTYLSVIFSTTNATWTGLESNPNVYSYSTAVNCLSHCMGILGWRWGILNFPNITCYSTHQCNEKADSCSNTSDIQEASGLNLAILTEVLCGIPQSLLASASIKLKLDHNCFEVSVLL